MKTTKNGKNVNGEDRNRLVFVVVPVEQPDLAERGGGQNAVAVVVEENAAFGGGFGVLADFLDGRFHAVETGVVETFELIASRRVDEGFVELSKGGGNYLENPIFLLKVLDGSPTLLSVIPSRFRLV